MAFGKNIDCKTLIFLPFSYQNKKGVIIGQTSILVHATPRIGFKHVFLSSGVKLQKQVNYVLLLHYIFITFS